MNRCLLIAVTLAYGHALAQNQTSTLPETRAENPLSTEVRQAYNTVKSNLLKSAEQMPEENYSFKPTSDIRSFAQVIAHAAESQMRTCSAVTGGQKSIDGASKTSKADLIGALNEAFAQCDKAYEMATDADAANLIKTPRGQRTKLGALIGNTIHDNEQYGILTVYLRLKGLIPPSSQR
jgi:uncharacterized damage-inducible protein DinB